MGYAHWEILIMLLSQFPLSLRLLCNNDQNFLKSRYQSILVCPILHGFLTFFQIFCHRLSSQANLWSWLVPVHFKPQYLYTFINFEVFLKSLMEIWAERVNLAVFVKHRFLFLLSLVFKVLDSQSRGPVFKTTGWLQGRLSLSSFRGR